MKLSKRGHVLMGARWDLILEETRLLALLYLPRKRSKCEVHILRRIIFYFILRTQLIPWFCSIIFYFPPLFYFYVLLFLFDVYNVFVSLFFSYVMYSLIPFLLNYISCEYQFWFIILSLNSAISLKIPYFLY